MTKTVAIASGKGGTGKTTVSAVFALISSQRYPVAIIDADVEASNLPLVLRADDAECISFPGAAKAAIKADLCIGCGACVQECRFDAITVADSGLYLVDHFACEGCTSCVGLCPVGAIDMTPTAAGRACLGTSPSGPIAYGQLDPGEDLSGRLVTEVRRLGSDAADEHDAHVLLIDGPPGIGCPLTAAIASADLLVAVAEPTVSGAHDLDRLESVAKRLGLPVVVVLNKSDLSAEGAQRIRELARTRGLPLLAEVPFDECLAILGDELASSTAGFEADRSPGLAAIARAWSQVEQRLEL